jgi:hypothetical protein
MGSGVAERRWPVATAAALPIALGLLLSMRDVRPAAADPAGTLSVADIGDRLRVTAKPGDPKLQNAHATAAVRLRDGWLTEFWPNRLRLPTEPQLGTTSQIDALWQVYPCVKRGRDWHAIVASSVRREGDAIVTEGSASVDKLEYRARTELRLDPQSATIVLTTTFSVAGKPAHSVSFGDSVRWGNVQYVVEGQPKALSKFRGKAGWIGRHGALGDLLLRRRDAAPMLLEFEEKDVGFAGPIYATYWTGVPDEPFTVTRALSFEALPRLPAPPAFVPARLEIAVQDESGRPLAAKVKLDRADRATPVFDRDGDITGANRFMWTGNGRLTRELEPGPYRLLISAGIERELFEQRVALEPGQSANVEARLARVLHTPGWLAADLHLHQAPSVDADVSLADRVISIAAEGVEFAVATDHYAVTDLGPTTRWLTERGVLAVPLQTVPGIEVSTVGRRFGHFNVFPMRAEASLFAEDTTPDELFPRARRAAPGGVLQVNHPRWEPHLGYFTYYDLDPETGEPRRAGYNATFDTVEVYNGADAYDLRRVERVFDEWLRLLGRGHRYAATGSSDSHKLAFLDPGLPRTMVHYGTSAGDERDALAPTQAVIAAIKRGHSIVTSGPMIDVSIDGQGPGNSVHASDGEVKLDLRVRAASWVDVREVSVLEGGSGRVLFRRQLPPSSGLERLVAQPTLRVTPPTFLVVVARGHRPLPNAAQVVRPFAFTNPIWVMP